MATISATRFAVVGTLAVTVTLALGLAARSHAPEVTRADVRLAARAVVGATALRAHRLTLLDQQRAAAEHVQRRCVGTVDVHVVHVHVHTHTCTCTYKPKTYMILNGYNVATMTQDEQKLRAK